MKSTEQESCKNINTRMKEIATDERSRKVGFNTKIFSRFRYAEDELKKKKCVQNVLENARRSGITVGVFHR